MIEIVFGCSTVVYCNRKNNRRFAALVPELTQEVAAAHSHLSVVYRTVPQAAKAVLAGGSCADLYGCFVLQLQPIVIEIVICYSAEKLEQYPVVYGTRLFLGFLLRLWAELGRWEVHR